MTCLARYEFAADTDRLKSQRRGNMMSEVR